MPASSSVIRRPRVCGSMARWNNLATAAVVVGVLLRLTTPFFMDIGDDASGYAAMGDRLAHHGDLTLPWGQWPDWAGPTPSHHFSPLYAGYLAGFYLALGFGVWQTKLAALVMGLGSLGAVHLASRDVVGKDRAVWVTGLVALEPGFVGPTGTGFTENLSLLCFAVTLWGIWRSLEKPWFMVVAGLGAAACYLARGGMGWFFFLAGFGGLGWRLLHRGWRSVAKDAWYLGAAALFLGVVAAWAYRNLRLFGDWQTSSYIEAAWGLAWASPGRFALGSLYKLVLYAGFLWPWLAVFVPELRRVRWLGEKESLLWTGGLLVALLGAFMASAFWVMENTSPFWFNTKRYMLLAYLPLAWLVVREAGQVSASFRKRWGALAVFLLLSTGVMFCVPERSTIAQATSDLRADLKPGMVLGVVAPITPYSGYTYMPTRDVSVVVCLNVTVLDCGPDHLAVPDLVITHWHNGWQGYDLMRDTRVERLFGLSHSDVYTYRNYCFGWEAYNMTSPVCDAYADMVKRHNGVVGQ